MAEFVHEALKLKEEKPLVYTAFSKRNAYFKMFISKFATEQGVVPLNPFMLFDYFLLDAVERDAVREANNSLVKRADEIWVFGQISDGVLAEIKIAQDLHKPIKYFKIENSQDIVPVASKNEIEMEQDVELFKDEINFSAKKIVICGSVFFANEMIEANKYLESKGYEVVLPWGIEDFVDGGSLQEELYSGKREQNLEGAKRKMEHNLIKGYYNEINQADAVLVINKGKGGVQGYIGGNSFLEIGFAHVLEKKIYCLNPLPNDLPVFYEELVAMQPIILDGDLSKMTL